LDNQNTGGVAFPNSRYADTFGMTLRDYFAAKALQGLLSIPELAGSHDDFAKNAYGFADAMALLPRTLTASLARKSALNVAQTSVLRSISRTMTNGNPTKSVMLAITHGIIHNVLKHG
jgi:hypothetical protein